MNQRSKFVISTDSLTGQRRCTDIKAVLLSIALRLRHPLGPVGAHTPGFAHMTAFGENIANSYEFFHGTL